MDTLTDKEKFRLSLLTPGTRARAEGIIARMVDRGWNSPYVGSTYRTEAEQREALLRGTTGRKQKLSWHLIKRAVDFRFRLPNNEPDPTTHQEAFFLALWEEATAIGCRSLGYVRDKAGHPVKLYINGGKLWDAGHVEYRAPYKTLIDAVEKEAPHLLESEPAWPPDPDDDEEAAQNRALGLDSLPPSPFK